MIYPEEKLSGRAKAHCAVVEPPCVFSGADRQQPWRLLRIWALPVLLLLLLAAAACNRQTKASVPPQATAPAISVPPTPQIGQQPAPPVQTTPPPATSAETGVIPRSSTGRTASQPKPHSGKSSARKVKPTPPPSTAQATAQKPAGSEAAQAATTKPAGSEPTQVQIGVQVPQGTAQNTEQLLQSADGNLRRVTRSLSEAEQAMARQVRTYISQSRTATRDGDLERAHNLALKANLLSAELAK
jgi:predicted component of type VI protein secretion system